MVRLMPITHQELVDCSRQCRLGSLQQQLEDQIQAAYRAYSAQGFKCMGVLKLKSSKILMITGIAVLALPVISNVKAEAKSTLKSTSSSTYIIQSLEKNIL